jgi:membrane protein DedA with SNARE-associated domain
MEHVSHFFLSIIDRAGYPGLFVVMVLGNMGVPVGAEFVVAAAGALTATGHLSSLWLTGTVATLGEMVGGGLLYAIGYFGGRPVVVKYGKYIKLDEKKLDAFTEFYDRHGNVVVFVCRFLPLVRGVSALPAGVSRMPKMEFFAYTLAGSAVFCFGLVWLGDMFGEHFGEIAPIIHKASAGFIVGIIILAVILVVFGVARSRQKANQTP